MRIEVDIDVKELANELVDNMSHEALLDHIQSIDSWGADADFSMRLYRFMRQEARVIREECCSDGDHKYCTTWGVDGFCDKKNEEDK